MTCAKGLLEGDGEFVEIRKEELKRLYQQILDYENLISNLKNQNLKLEQDLRQYIKNGLKIH